jgi:hypothetical protein
MQAVRTRLAEAKMAHVWANVVRWEQGRLCCSPGAVATATGSVAHDRQSRAYQHAGSWFWHVAHGRHIDAIGIERDGAKVPDAVRGNGRVIIGFIKLEAQYAIGADGKALAFCNEIDRFCESPGTGCEEVWPRLNGNAD